MAANIRTGNRLLLLAAILFLCGCGTYYKLPGHSESQHSAPVVLHEGERRLALKMGPGFHYGYWKSLGSEDPDIVSVVKVGPDPGDPRRIYLVGVRPGTAAVHYGNAIHQLPERADADNQARYHRWLTEPLADNPAAYGMLRLGLLRKFSEGEFTVTVLPAESDRPRR